MKPYLLAIILLVISQATIVEAANAQKLEVKIIDRQDSAANYTDTAPAYFNSQSNTNVNCYGDVNCNATTSTTGSISPSRQTSDQVRGSTITLQLPHGRRGVVSCESKYVPRGDYSHRRDWRMP